MRTVFTLARVHAVAAILLLTTAASAHDAARPGLDNWFSTLKNAYGTRCCSGPEGSVVLDSDWESHDGHYRVRLNGEWIEVPDDKVVTAPNLDGRVIVWPLWINGHATIRCFMPGSMT